LRSAGELLLLTADLTRSLDWRLEADTFIIACLEKIFAPPKLFSFIVRELANYVLMRTAIVEYDILLLRTPTSAADDAHLMQVPDANVVGQAVKACLESSPGADRSDRGMWLQMAAPSYSAIRYPRR
jgi:hypothetical protein